MKIKLITLFSMLSLCFFLGCTKENQSGTNPPSSSGSAVESTNPNAPQTPESSAVPAAPSNNGTQQSTPPSK